MVQKDIALEWACSSAEEDKKYIHLDEDNFEKQKEIEVHKM